MDYDTDYPYQINLKKKKFEIWGNKIRIACEGFTFANDSILLFLLIEKVSNEQVQRIKEILRSFKIKRVWPRQEKSHLQHVISLNKYWKQSNSYFVFNILPQGKSMWIIRPITNKNIKQSGEKDRKKMMAKLLLFLMKYRSTDIEQKV